MVGSLEVRDAIGGEIRDVDDQSHTVQAFFPHEVVDTYKTTFSPECFRASFATEKPLMCWQHKLDEPLGRSIKAQATRKGNELIGRFSDFDDVPLARRAWSQIKDGTLTDFSFGFKDSKRRAHPDKELRGVEQIYEASMKEFSPVSIGSIPGAKATGIRQEEDLVTEFTPDQIAELVRHQVVTPEQGQAMLLRSHPELREVIRVAPKQVTAQDVRDALEESHPEIAQAIRSSDLVLAAPGANPFEQRSEPESDLADYAQAVQAALEAAVDSGLRVEDGAMTDEVREMVGLVNAAEACSNELLERMGLRASDDDDDDDEGDDDDEDHNAAEEEDDWGKTGKPFKGAAKPFKKGGGPRREDVDLALRALNFHQDERDQLAKQGKALPDGSYPIPDGEKGKKALESAAILVKSGHGNVAAAKALIAKRAKELGVKNPLEDDSDSDSGRSAQDEDEVRAQQIIERRLQTAGRTL